MRTLLPYKERGVLKKKGVASLIFVSWVNRSKNLGEAESDEEEQNLNSLFFWPQKIIKVLALFDLSRILGSILIIYLVNPLSWACLKVEIDRLDTFLSACNV